MARLTQVGAKTETQDGAVTVAVQHQETDCPQLPVAELERLYQLDPALVTWVVEQTEAEANHRRRETSRVNWFIFTEHMTGQVFAFLIGLSGMVGGAYVALQGQPVAGGIIASVTIGTLATAFVKGRKPKKSNEVEPEKTSKKKGSPK